MIAKLTSLVAALPHRLFVGVGLAAVVAGFGLEVVDLATARFEIDAAWIAALGAFLSTVVGAARHAERELQADHDGDGVPLMEDPDEWPALGRLALGWLADEFQKAKADGDADADDATRLWREAHERFAEPSTVAPPDSDGGPT